MGKRRGHGLTLNYPSTFSLAIFVDDVYVIAESVEEGRLAAKLARSVAFAVVITMGLLLLRTWPTRTRTTNGIGKVLRILRSKIT
jgi:hypothetical protein